MFILKYHQISCTRLPNFCFCISPFQVPTSGYPWAPRRFAKKLHLGSQDFHHLNCLGLPGVGPIIYCQSTKLSVDAAWWHFQLQTYLPSIAAFLMQNLFQSWGENFKTFKSMVLKPKL